MSNSAEKVVRLGDLKKVAQESGKEYATQEAVDRMSARLEKVITTDNVLFVTEILKIMEEM